VPQISITKVLKVLKTTEYPIKPKQSRYDRLGDEASIRSDYHGGTTWAKKGESPIVKTIGARFSVTMISAVCGTGEIRFMVTEKTCTAPFFIDFLKRLIHERGQPVFLIVDGHPVHKSKGGDLESMIKG
jgi:hypothetical protein